MCGCEVCERELDRVLDVFAAEVRAETLLQASRSVFAAMHEGARKAKSGWCAGMLHAAHMLRPKPPGPQGGG